MGEVKCEKEKGKVKSKGVDLRNAPLGAAAVIIASDAFLRNFISTLRPSVFYFLKNTIPLHNSSAVLNSTYERNSHSWSKTLLDTINGDSSFEGLLEVKWQKIS